MLRYGDRVASQRRLTCRWRIPNREPQGSVNERHELATRLAAWWRRWSTTTKVTTRAMIDADLAIDRSYQTQRWFIRGTRARPPSIGRHVATWHAPPACAAHTPHAAIGV